MVTKVKIHLKMKTNPEITQMYYYLMANDAEKHNAYII